MPVRKPDFVSIETDGSTVVLGADGFFAALRGGTWSRDTSWDSGEAVAVRDPARAAALSKAARQALSATEPKS